MKIKNKKAQYYLLAAAVIIAVLIGVSFVTNYAITRKKPIKFYDLGDELKEECARIIDYGIYNELNVTDLINDFVQEDLIKYVGQKEMDIELVFIYGEKENIKIATSTNETLVIGRVGYETVFEDGDADWECIDETWKGKIELINQNVLLKNCTVNGKVEVSGGGGLKINSSTIDGNVGVSTGTNLELIHNYVTGQVSASGDGNKIIINNTIGKEVHVLDGTLFITDNIIDGSLKTSTGQCPEIIQIGDNTIGGLLQLCRGADIDIIVEVFNNTYDFDSQEGINCFFVLAKEEGGEVYILESDKL